jgi:hypothetical protein
MSNEDRKRGQADLYADLYIERLLLPKQVRDSNDR